MWIEKVEYLLRFRFYILSLLLLLLMVCQTINGQWIADFWEHSAVVRELATNPFSPKHPQLLLEAPHAFYSPYLLTVACISRLTGASAVTTLAVVGIVNLVLLLFGLRVFLAMFMPAHAGAASFYTLLFTLVLWGEAAWGYSGFFHLRVLGYVLPYPSTFAMACTLIALPMYLFSIRKGNLSRLIPVLAIAVIVLLTHPHTFVFLAIGLVAITVGERNATMQDYARLAGLFILTCLIAAIWPYYPFFKLILSESVVYHSWNRIMYEGFIGRIFPSLIGIPLLLLRLRSNRRDVLVFTFFGLCLIFVYGGLSGIWSHGRVISNIVLMLHIAIAASASRLESHLKWRDLPRGPIKIVYSGLIIFVQHPVSWTKR